VSIIEIPMVPTIISTLDVVATLVFSSGSTSRGRSVSGGGTNKNGETTKSGGINPSMRMWGPNLHAFNPIMEFLQKLQQNYQGVQIEILKILMEFQCKTHVNL